MALAGNDGRILANVKTASGETTKVHSPEEKMPLLTLGALGVVYGDIGTSPIYALREALHAATGGAPAAPEQVLGVLSLIFWALTVIVTIKYIAFVLRADNNGEGGILSLIALVRGSFPSRPVWILVVGIFGAALFLGDAVITPAISVLSAVEGIEVVTPTFHAYVVPLTLVILAVLFAVQRFGTSKVASVFGPVTLLWFVAIAISGIVHIADDLSVFAAINPLYIAYFLVHSPGYVICDNRRGVSGCDRGRGTLCGSRPFRTQADRAGLALDRLSQPVAQLFRTGRFRARQQRCGWPSFLRNERGVVADPNGGAGDGCDRDRQSGSDFRRVFAGPPGCAT